MTPSTLHRFALSASRVLGAAGIPADAAEVRFGRRGPRLAQLDIALDRGADIDRVLRMGSRLAQAMDVRSVRVVPAAWGEVSGASAEVVLPRTEWRVLTAGECVAPGSRALEVGLGLDAAGALVRFRFDGATPHLGIWGKTRCGKSEAVRLIVWQLAMRHGPEDLALALIDGKNRGLVPFASLPHLVAPVATTPEDGAALIAALDVELAARRDEVARCARPLVVVVDEASLFVGAAGEGLRNLAGLGAELGVRLLVASQHPTSEAVSRLVTANLGARLVGAAGDDPAARLMMGGRSEAPRLLQGYGDFLLVTDDPERPRRLQCGMVTAGEYGRLPVGGEMAAQELRARTPPMQRSAHAGHASRPTTPDEVGRVAGWWQDGRAPGIGRVKREMGCGDGHARRLLAEAEALVRLGGVPASRHPDDALTRAHAGATTTEGRTG